jgi:hypothetical protein
MAKIQQQHKSTVTYHVNNSYRKVKSDKERRLINNWTSQNIRKD